MTANGFNYTIFRDCFSSAMLERIMLHDASSKPQPKFKKSKTKPATVTEEQRVSDADDLAEFIEVTAMLCLLSLSCSFDWRSI